MLPLTPSRLEIKMRLGTENDKACCYSGVVTNITNVQNALSPKTEAMMNSNEIAKRLSIRKVAMLHGIPPRVVSRAVAQGELPAIRTKTETGRDRVYISYEDARAWVSSLQNEMTTAR
jgi:hypothetical protein